MSAARLYCHPSPYGGDSAKIRAACTKRTDTATLFSTKSCFLPPASVGSAPGYLFLDWFHRGRAVRSSAHPYAKYTPSKKALGERGPSLAANQSGVLPVRQPRAVSGSRTTASGGAFYRGGIWSRAASTEAHTTPFIRRSRSTQVKGALDAVKLSYPFPDRRFRTSSPGRISPVIIGAASTASPRHTGICLSSSMFYSQARWAEEVNQSSRLAGFPTSATGFLGFPGGGRSRKWATIRRVPLVFGSQAWLGMGSWDPGGASCPAEGAISCLISLSCLTGSSLVYAETGTIASQTGHVLFPVAWAHFLPFVIPRAHYSPCMRALGFIGGLPCR